MYQVPESLDCSFLVGSVVLQVCVGSYQTTLQLTEGISISIESRFSISGESEIVECRNPQKACCLVELLDKRIVKAQVDAPKSIAIHFDDGQILRLLDSNETLESFQISTPTQMIVV